MGAKSLGLIVLSLWFVLCQGSNHCPRLRSCNCSDFGKIRFKVRCVGLYSVPTAIPSNTAMLNLSGNYLDAVYTGSFGNLTFLSKMDLSRNRLRFIAKDAFENLTSLKVINLEKNFIKGGFYFPESLVNINLNNNEVSFDDLKVILRGLKKLRSLNIDRNRRLGPVLTSDIFAGMVKMECLSMKYCTFEHIESGAFQSMHNLTEIDLSNNLLSHLQPGALEGPGDQLINLFLSSNRIRTVAEGTFKRFEKLNRCYLNGNSLKSVPDLTGLTALSNLDLSANRIMDVTRIGKSGIQVIFGLSLSDNQIKSLPENVFHNFSVIGHLDLSFNKLQSIPDDTFAGFKNLSYLVLSFNRISGINRRTFSGLKKLEALMMVKNNLTFLPEDAFAETSLKILFLHNNGITRVHRNSLSGLKHLKSLTLFDNPLRILPDGLFDNSSSNMNLFITCKNLRKLPKETHNSNIQCAPSTSFFYIVSHVAQLNLYKKSMIHSGFVCLPCTTGTIPSPECLNCTLCGAGYYRNFDYFDDVCQPCPAGGFYQDEMGHVETAGCKRCSVGTYVSVQRHPGKSANDCWACPYGTLSNETADHRACKCLHNFYRLDRFGPCSPCPPHGLVCENDTAVLAPNYFWRWSNQSNKNLYKSFVDTTRVPGVECNETFSAFKGSLPKPIKCPYAGSCKGGIDSDCREEYQGNLCATCASGYYLRFHTCLKCPRLIVSLISSVVVIAIFVVVFLMFLWGDSKKTENDRTVADVIMSCFKIVIGFYQVIIGIFSALARVQWPVALISMERCMKLFEGNIFQFAPLSCIYPQLRLDQFFRFILVLSVNASAVSLIFIYLFLKRRLIKKRQGFSESEKKLAVSCLKKSCYRNIFLFLLASYPVTSKQIIQILPLPGACVEHCFTNDKSQCISLLRADYSIKCFTSQHNLFWPIAAAFSVYPLGFPVIVLFLIHKYRQSPGNEEIAFGLKVFFENYEDKFWFWEVTEMYRKLILIALIFLFGSESLSQIGLTVFTVSAFGVAHTFFRPIKDEFEERLQTFVLWVIFFDVCLGAMYTNCEITHGRKRNDSLLVNVLFVVLNSSVLLVALGKGIRYAKFFWKTVSRCLMQCFHIFRHGATFVKNEAFSFLQKLNFAPQRFEGSEREPLLSHLDAQLVKVSNNQTIP